MQHVGEGYVYIFKIHEFCKIGISNNPMRRMRQVSTLSPYKVEEFYVSRLFEKPEDVERKMHSYFWKEREHGEWFRIPFNTAVEVLEQFTKSFKTIDEGARMRIAAEKVAEAFDANHDLVEYISSFPASTAGSGLVQKGNFTVPSGAHYLKFKMANAYGSTYNSNVSINFPTVDILYHQHVGSEHSTTIPSTELQPVVGTNVIQNNLDADMTVEFACEDPKENSLTVMTYNVQYFDGLNADETMQADILDEYEASIIGLQELRYDYKRSPETNVFDPRYWNMRVGNEFLPNGFATNYGLSNVQHHFFTNQYSTEDKGYETAEMKFKGKTVFLVCTHLTTEAHNTEKYAQMGELLNLVSTKESFIMMGDFNTVCTNTSHEDYTSGIKMFVDAGYNVANCSDQHGFIGTYTSGKTSSSTFYPIDNIITSADFTMSNVRRDTIKIAKADEDGTKVIDHVPLICELTL